MNAAALNSASINNARQRLPAVVAFVLFVALCVSIAYWVLQWLAPAPRPVAAPVANERAMPPVSAAANLFGGAAKGGGMVNVQLRGILHAGRSAGSAAILAVDGSPPKFYRVNAELMPGVTVKAIHAKTVVLSDRGAERELPLPAFAAQEGTGSGSVVRAMPEQTAPQNLPPPSSPGFQPQQVPQQPGQQGLPSGAAPGQQVMPQAQGPAALPPQASQGAGQAAGPSALGSTGAGVEQPLAPGTRAGRSPRRPRYQDD